MIKKFSNRIIIATSLLAMTLVPTGEVRAQDAVTIIEDVSASTISRTINAELAKLSSAISAGNLQAFINKENFLDGVAWEAAKEFQQQINANLLKWLGGQGEGQNGNIPFITNFEDYFADEIQKVAGPGIFDPNLAPNCSEEKTHTHRVQLYEWFNDTYSKQNTLQCEDANSATGNSGVRALDRIMMSYVNCTDAACGSLAKQDEVATDITARVTNAAQAASIAGGFKPQEICKTTTDPFGTSWTKCEYTKPLRLDADSTSFLLTELPALQLLNTDEFNEVVSGLMSNLTNQIVTGFTGVLGLSGNSEYGQNIFGPSGNLSYADALAQDDISQYQSRGNNPIKRALETENKYIALQQEIVDGVEELEEELERNEDEFPSCFDLELTEELEEAKETAEGNLRVSTTTLQVLITLDDQYDNAADSNTKNAVVATFMEYQAQGLFRTEYENQELELSYINYEFAEMVDEFKYDTAVARYDCGGDFNYEGPQGDEPDDEDE